MLLQGLKTYLNYFRKSLSLVLLNYEGHTTTAVQMQVTYLLNKWIELGNQGVISHTCNSNLGQFTFKSGERVSFCRPFFRLPKVGDHSRWMLSEANVQDIKEAAFRVIQTTGGSAIPHDIIKEIPSLQGALCSASIRGWETSSFHEEILDTIN